MSSEPAAPQSGDSLQLLPGSPVPLGATWTGQGVNFSVYSETATRIELCLYDDEARSEVARLELPARSGGIRHGFLPLPAGRAGLVYGYRADGPYTPGLGLRHNAAKLLIDPYARALAGRFEWHDALFGYAREAPDDLPDTADSAPFNYKCRVVDPGFDWSGDHAPAVPWRDTVIYELHVKGFTQRHPEVPEGIRGTYLGLAHPAAIGHLKRLGITAVELLPVQAFVNERFLVEKGLVNYWGYNPVAWFAPTDRYAVHDPVVEFKTMVRSLHAAGIEVIIDVVFNHTAEGNEFGPTLSLRGLDNRSYYRLGGDRRRYQNHTGCGNTLAIGHAATRRMVLDCLRYWVQEMRVDGFRFDLAPVLGRDDDHFRADSAFFKAVRADPTLRYIKLIAEPWDVAADGYQLGSFPAGWSEWNDRYRDAVRAFWRGEAGLIGQFAERFAGSSDLFRHHGRRPTASVNFITCHDGFTLHDLTAYQHKHNESNLEQNGDGHDHNLSWNCGEEGPSSNPAVIELRERQMRNFLATLCLSAGVPMLQAGDELGRTQLGNNNAYCQDSPLTWMDWHLSRQRPGLIEFVRQLLLLRRQASGLRRDTFLKGSRRFDRPLKDVSWIHPQGREMSATDWQDPSARAIGVLIGQAFVDLNGRASGHLCVLCNAGSRPERFILPAPNKEPRWSVLFDTSHWNLRDPSPSETESAVSGAVPQKTDSPTGAGEEVGALEATGVRIGPASYRLAPHSLAVLADGAAPSNLRTTFVHG